MKSPVPHWGVREWRSGMDDLVPDPAHPRAFPSTYPMDLMGRIRVKLCAEDGNLVAYGFGGQRVVLPAKSVGAVCTLSSFRIGRVTHGSALLVLDHDDRILLRANGMWETYGEVQKVCRRAKVPSPKHVVSGSAGSFVGDRRPPARARRFRPDRYRRPGDGGFPAHRLQRGGGRAADRRLGLARRADGQPDLRQPVHPRPAAAGLAPGAARSPSPGAACEGTRRRPDRVSHSPSGRPKTPRYK